jgi:molybdopterin-binding protein
LASGSESPDAFYELLGEQFARPGGGHVREAAEHGDLGAEGLGVDGEDAPRALARHRVQAGGDDLPVLASPDLSFLCASSVGVDRKRTSATITSEEHLMKLSARNQIPARVTAIQAGEAIANVELDANGVRMVASITLEAVKQLGLTEGSTVIAVVKASDVILATVD